MEIETGWYWDWYIVGFFQCYRDNKVENELSGVRKCLQDEDGNIKKFIEGLGEETNNLKPDPHKWVPWIVFNDVRRNQLVGFFEPLDMFVQSDRNPIPAFKRRVELDPVQLPAKAQTTSVLKALSANISQIVASKIDQREIKMCESQEYKKHFC